MYLIVCMKSLMTKEMCDYEFKSVKGMIHCLCVNRQALADSFAILIKIERYIGRSTSKVIISIIMLNVKYRSNAIHKGVR